MVGRAADAHDLADAGKRIALARQRIQGLQIVVLEEAVDGDEHARVRMGEQVGELAPGRPGVDGDHGAAEQRAGKGGEDPLRPVAHEQRDLVAPADAEGMQPLREPPHLLSQRAVVEARACAYQRLVVGIARRQLVEQGGNRLGVGRAHASGLAARKVCGP